MIPCGPSNPHRAQRDGGLEIEYREVSGKGTPVTAGEHVSTLVRKLYTKGDISAEEYMAAQRYSGDFEAAYEASANALAAVYVDSKGGGSGGAENRLSHAMRYQEAKAYLRSLGLVADAAILGDRSAGIKPTFTGIGAVFAPRRSKADWLIIGQHKVAFICQELAAFYALSRGKKRNAPARNWH